MNEVCVEKKYLDNIGKNKEQPSGSKHTYHQYASKKGKKNWKGKDKKTRTTTQLCKDPNENFNHSNIHGYTQGKCLKIHPYLNLGNHKKYSKKKKMIALFSIK
jgi:hypothetical protein